MSLKGLRQKRNSQMEVGTTKRGKQTIVFAVGYVLKFREVNAEQSHRVLWEYPKTNCVHDAQESGENAWTRT